MHTLTFIFLALLSTTICGWYSTTVISQQSIPSVTLTELLKRNGIEKVELIMGHLTSNQPGNFFPSGIVAHFFSLIALERVQLSKLASSFGVSTNFNFAIQDGDRGEITVADPNDKLCNQQIEFLFRQFLPCRNYLKMGLKHLLPLDKLTSSYLGMHFTYQQNQMTLKIVKEQMSPSQQSLEYAQQTACGQVTVAYHQRLGEENRMGIAVKRVSLSKWYNPQKAIAFIIQQTKANPRPDSVQILIRLPTGFILKDITAITPNTPFNTSLQSDRNGSSLIRICLQLPLPFSEAIIHLYFQAGFPLFETFSSTGAGGEELMILTKATLGQRQDYLYEAPVMAEQLLQPDFSINFHTITACTATILLIWLTLWRNFQLSPAKSSLD